MSVILPWHGLQELLNSGQNTVHVTACHPALAWPVGTAELRFDTEERGCLSSCLGMACCQVTELQVQMTHLATGAETKMHISHCAHVFECFCCCVGEGGQACLPHSCMTQLLGGVCGALV